MSALCIVAVMQRTGKFSAGCIDIVNLTSTALLSTARYVLSRVTWPATHLVCVFCRMTGVVLHCTVMLQLKAKLIGPKSKGAVGTRTVISHEFWNVQRDGAFTTTFSPQALHKCTKPTVTARCVRVWYEICVKVTANRCACPKHAVSCLLHVGN